MSEEVKLIEHIAGAYYQKITSSVFASLPANANSLIASVILTCSNSARNSKCNDNYYISFGDNPKLDTI